MTVAWVWWNRYYRTTVCVYPSGHALGTCQAVTTMRAPLTPGATQAFGVAFWAQTGV